MDFVSWANVLAQAPLGLDLPLTIMFGPPCRRCGSEMHWARGRDGEQCDNCNWPEPPLESPVIIARQIERLRAMLTDARKQLSEWEGSARISSAPRPNAAGWWYDARNDRWRWCFEDAGMGLCARDSKADSGHYWRVSRYKPDDARWYGPWIPPNASGQARAALGADDSTD